MSGSSTWFGWLDGLVTALLGPAVPLPGTHEARLEEDRLGALLDKEVRKPAGQRDTELVHRLRVDYRKCQLENAQVEAAICHQKAEMYDQPAALQCCAAVCWVRQRAAASYRALHDYTSQHIQQMTEELAAAEARRPAVIVAQPTLRLYLSGALQQAPARMDMCSACARLVQEIELAEQPCRVHAEKLAESNSRRGLQAAPDATAKSQRASGLAAAASPAAATATAAVAASAAVMAGAETAAAQDVPAEKSQQGEKQQRQQAKEGAGAGSVAGRSGSALVTPKDSLLPQQPQHACSDQGQQQQTVGAADEASTVLPEVQQQQQQQQQQVGAAGRPPPLLPEEQRQQQQQPP